MDNFKPVLRAVMKRFCALLLILFILLPAFPVVSIEDGSLNVDFVDNPLTIDADAAQVTSGSGTWISGKLTYTYSVTSDGTSSNGAAGTVSASGGTLTVTATNSKKSSHKDGCDDVEDPACSTTTTVTVTNASQYPLMITNLTTGGSASVAGVSQGDTIASGSTFTITVSAPAKDAATPVSGTVTIAVEEKTNVTITLAPSPYVEYTVNGKAVAKNGTEQAFDIKVGNTVSLPPITAPSGYEFKGWKIGNKALSTASSFTADAGYTVFPVIVTEGTDTTAANFKVGSISYTFWEDAVSAAVSGGGTVFVNLTSVSLPDNVLDNLLPAAGGTYVKPVTGGGVEYILPAGVSLVVPYSASTTVHTTTPAYSFVTHTDPSPFRTLTVPNGAKITVNGAVSVDSAVCANGQNATSWNGTPTGPHGKIVMKSGSEMTLNSGANLYCYGYINGDGNIYVNSGAKVYELFQFRDWRGGTATSNIEGNDYYIFPMNQYYVQNVEAPMTLYKGATEYVWSVVNMSSDAYPTKQIEFIGTNGMFKLIGGSSDHLTKRYDAHADRLEIAVHGNMSLNALNVTITGLPFIGSIDMQSADYVLPINNMNIIVESGTTSIADSQVNGVAFLPGSQLTVNHGATFTVNAPTYFYDEEDWGAYAADNLRMVAVGYSTANGTSAIRTADNLIDAEMDVNGTVNVSNKLYTTEHGAYITSSNGTGVINFTADCATATATTYQYTQSGTSCTKHDITVNNAWLQNGDKSYSKTVSTGQSTWKYDKNGEHWYRYKVDFKFNNNIVATDYYCENNDTVTYDASWLTDLGATVTPGSASAAIDGTNINVTNVAEDSTVTLTGVPAEYKPTFVLSEEEYTKHYLLYNSTPLTQTTINGETYYIVAQGNAPLAVGTTYAAPTDASMGVKPENHNTITWNMSGLSATSGDPYRGIVPAGETAQGPVYIYGFYEGVIAHNSWNDQYYPTLIEAFEVLPQDVSATITLHADCGTFEEESGTVAYTAYTANNVTLDLNGHNAVGRIVNSGNFTLELNGGSFNYETGATAEAAAYKGMAAVINNGTMTIQDSVGGGKISADAISNASGADGSAVIRNNNGATLTVTGKDSDNLLTLKEIQTEIPIVDSKGNTSYHAYNYGIFNLGRIAALTDVDITASHSRTTGVNVYNYNTGVIDTITRGHMYSYSGTSLFNYGGTITTVDGLTIDGKNGITNRNMRTGAIASGYTVTEANKGIIDTIENCHIEVGQYAINNNAVINTVTGSTLIAHPDSAQVDTRGNGSTASDGNVQCYTVVNSANWWYDSNVWKQVDSSSGGYTRVNTYKEDEQYRPSIGTITNCEIYAENTSTSTSYGYALMNYGVINKIGGTTNIKTYKHPDNAKISVSHYAMQNLSGGIIKSIEGTVNTSCTGVGTVYNDGAFTTQINYTYANKVGGNITYQKNIYGQPSTINSITCSGTWSCGGSSSYYYALYNTGYIQTINATGLTLRGGYNVLYNAANGASSTYEITRKYTDGATSSTEYERDTSYVKNLEKGSTIGTINGITVNVYGTKVYQGINNQGHIGTLSNVNVGFESGATNNTSSYPLVLNGDSRYQSYTETILTNRTAETDPHLTVTAGKVTRYDRDYTYTTPPTIDTIDNLTVTSIGTYAFRNAGHIGTLKNSTITGTQYSLHNYANGPYTERQTRQYYSGTGIFTTTKNAGELSKHYKRNPAEIDTIDNCKITTPANTYAMFNSGHVGTIKNSTLQAGTTTAKAYALANSNSQEREYTRNLETILYVTANTSTACTAYYGSGGESDVVTYDYDVPVIDLIGEGNTFKATSTVIANTGIITEINSGDGELTTVTGSAAKGSSIYNYSCVLDSRTTTTPYTAATTASASGTKGTAVNDDVNQPGATIGTIKNVYINANGYGILNGDGNTGKLPTIGEIGEGTEIYAHCTTKEYHAIANANYAKITEISGGTYTVTTATTNAYRNGYNNAETATLISGGNFKGMSATRDNAIYKPDDTNRVVYPAGKKLSTNSRSVSFNNGTTVASGTGYYYIVDTYTVTWKSQDGATTLETDENVPQGDVPTYDGTAPSKAADAQYTYAFAGWSTEPNAETGTAMADLPVVSADVTYYAAFSKTTNKYTVTWKSQDGNSTLETDANVTYGTAPSYNGTAPTKAATAQYTYTFAGWSTSKNAETGTAAASLPAVSADVTYYAAFSETVKTYAITWVDGDGNTLKTEQVAYGTTPSYDGATPTKAATAQYSYIFAGWSTDGSTVIDPLPDVTEDVTYKAVFTQTVNKYTITWRDGDGRVLTTSEVAYGTTPTYPGSTTPTKTATAQYTYTFNSTWSPEIVPVTGNAAYTAQFDQTVNEYTITWVDGNGETLKTEQVAYGTTPSYSGDTPTKTATAQYTYTFNSTWSPAITSVTEAATYTAQFDSTVNKYEITWVDGDGKTIKTEQVAYGTTPSYSGDTPTKTATAQYTYTFNSTWSPAITSVTEAATYTAQFSSTVNEYTVTFVDENGTELQSSDVAYGSDAEYTAAEPTKAKTAKYTYTFSGWTTDDGETVLTTEEAQAAEVTGEVTYTAVYDAEINKYQVTWQNYDGTELEVDPAVEYDATPEYNAPVPTKPETEQYRYEFIGWDYSFVPFDADVASTGSARPKNLAATGADETETGIRTVEGTTTYTAKFEEIEKTFTVIWNDENNEQIEMVVGVAYGTRQSHAAPSKAATAEYTYTFAGWDYSYTAFGADAPTTGRVNAGDAFLDVKANITYTAVFTAAKNKYDITWLNDDDSVIDTTQVEYGVVPTHADASKAATAQYTYTFTGWDTAPVAVTGPATYKATYTSAVNEYTITWLDGNGDVLTTDTLAYGETPSYDGETPTKAADAQYTYTFNNTWTPAITEVIGDATYTAQFSTTTNSYTVNWKNGDKIIETDYVAYGETPHFDGAEPTKATDNNYTYEFTGWSPEVKAVTGDVTYAAQFEAYLIMAGHSLTPEDDVEVNFYVNLNDHFDNENVSVKLYWGEGADHGEAQFAISELTDTDKLVTERDGSINTENYVAKAKHYTADIYKFTACVAAKQMNDDITVEISENGETVSTSVYHYHVVDYCYTVIENENGEIQTKMGYSDDEYAKLTDLCKAMANYGAKAQQQFSYNTDKPADYRLVEGDLGKYTYTEADASKFAQYYGADYVSAPSSMTKFYGPSMLLEAETTYVLWFEYSGSYPTNVTATIYDPIEKKNVAFKVNSFWWTPQYVRFNILNIPARLLTEDIKVNFDGETVTYNVGTYFYGALSGSDTTLKTTVNALYHYNQASVDYYKTVNQRR